MRTLKPPDTPILSGYQIHHTYIRPHEALIDKTPGELAGVQVKGKDKWLMLVQNACFKSTPKNSDVSSQ